MLNMDLFADLIKHITDPEHPLTLEQLRVVEEDLIAVDNEKNTINVYFTPTIPYCSLATLIGLSLRVKLMRSLPERFKVSVQITPGTHISEKSINKQLADKERIAAAIESKYLSDLINQCIALTPEEKDLPPLYDILRNDLEIAANLITPIHAKI